MRACSTKTDSKVTGIFSLPYKWIFWVTKCKTSERTSNTNGLISTTKATLCRCGSDPCNNLTVLNLFDEKAASSQLPEVSSGCRAHTGRVGRANGENTKSDHGG